MSKEPKMYDELFDAALDRIASAEDVDDQVEKEIQQYWINRIEEAERGNPTEAARLRLLMEFLDITG